MVITAPNVHVQRNYSRIPEVLPPPNLVQIQTDSFKWFQDEGLRDLLDEMSPIQDATREDRPRTQRRGQHSLPGSALFGCKRSDVRSVTYRAR